MTKAAQWMWSPPVDLRDLVIFCHKDRKPVPISSQAYFKAQHLAVSSVFSVIENKRAELAMIGEPFPKCFACCCA
jgi:hypothetical protein